jgi:Mg-chelatase subunit ChlD
MRRFLVAALTLGAFTRAAHADATLTALGGTDVSEGAYALAIDLRGLHASVEIRQTFVNAGTTDAEVLYEFELPSTAVIDGAVIAMAGKRDSAAFGADAGAAATPAPDDDASSSPADPLLVRVLDHETGDPVTGTPDLTRYELRAYPVPAKKAITVRTRFVVPLEVADGRVILRLPDRGNAPNLSRETGEVSFHAEGGIAGYDHVHVDDADATASGSGVRFAHTRRGAFVLDATPRVHGTEPLVWYDTAALDAKRGSISVSYFVPRPTATETLPFDRIAVLVDTSRSMDGAVDGVARVVDAILTQSTPQTQVQAILFDRSARPLGGWRASDSAARAEIGKAIRGAALANGTDLGEAMSAAGTALAGTAPDQRTLVVVVTDGLASLDTTGLDLVQRLGGAHPGLAVSFVLVTSDQSALPDVLHGALADVAYRANGMVLAARAGEVPARARSIAAELGHPAPVHDAALAGIDAAAGTALPSLLPAGSGGVITATYAGSAPSKIALDGARGEHPVHVAAHRAAAPDLADLVLASLDPAAIAPHAADADPAQEDAKQARELLDETRRRHGMVTDTTSLIAIDAASRFAAERRKLALGGGPFMRIPPPGDPAVGAPTPQVRIGSVHMRGDLDARLIHGMIETGLVPRARTCFQPLLLKQRESEGTIHLDLELSRGEVTSVRVARSDFTMDINTCIIDAAYQLDVPKTVVDDLPDTVSLVHYPLTFRSLAAGEVILPGDADSPDPIDTGVHVDDPDQPLGDGAHP